MFTSFDYSYIESFARCYTLTLSINIHEALTLCTLGFEFSGTVIAIGQEGDNEQEEQWFKERNIKIGTKVFGVTRFFAYATHIVVPK